MKIAIVVHHFDRDRGGAERFASDLALRMAGEAHEVHIHANTCREIPNGISYHKVPAVSRPRLLYEITFALNSSSEIQTCDYDVVLGVNRTLFQDIHVLPSAMHIWYRQDLKSIRNPLSRYLRGVSRAVSLKYRLMFYLEKRMYRHRSLKRVVANSNIVKESVIKNYGVAPDKMEVVYNDVDLEKFHPRNRAELRDKARDELGLKDEKLLLFVGHNFRLKGLHSFIKVISVLRERGLSGFKGLVVGRGKRKAYIREAKRLGCEDLIIFPGWQENIESVYAASDLLLLPTFYDSFSLTMLEALASGLPVVTTSYCGASELITDGLEGYIVDDPWDAGKLADGVAELLNGDRLEKCSVKARELAERFPPSSHYLRLMELCVDIAEEKRR